MAYIRINQIKFKYAQATLEYALIVTIVVTAITAMSVYVRRAVQANLKLIEEQINNEPSGNVTSSNVIPP